MVCQFEVDTLLGARPLGQTCRLSLLLKIPQVVGKPHTRHTAQVLRIYLVGGGAILGGYFPARLESLLEGHSFSVEVVPIFDVVDL